MAQAARDDSRLALVGLPGTKATAQPAEPDDDRPTEPIKDKDTPAPPAQPTARSRSFWDRISGRDPKPVEGDGSPPRKNPWAAVPRVATRLLQGVVMLGLGIWLGIANLHDGSGDMVYLLPILIGSLTLVAQGALVLRTVNEPRRHDAGARRIGGQSQIVLGFAMALAMLRFEGDDVLTWLGYAAGFLVFTSGWILLIRNPLSRSDS